ncbi:MAG: hypothetical protein KH009_04755 [Clostridiales bacterium]|nr:hypothetical protein [Clostridiales bacterium]
MKKTFAAALAAVMALSLGTTAYASNEVIDDAIELNKYIFEEKQSVSGKFLNLVASYPDETATLKTEDFAFTFHSEDIGDDIDDRDRIDLRIKDVDDRTDMYDKAVGRTTPKYAFELEADKFKVPFDLTVLDSNFMPGSTVHVYHLDSSEWDNGTLTNVFEAVKKDLLVDENGDITFRVKEGGTYLITAREIVTHEGTIEEQAFDFERTQRADISELLTYLKDDPNGYFTQLWEAPGHVAAEDEDDE